MDGPSGKQKGEQSVHTFNQVGTTEGKVYFGNVMKNNAKMAVMIRNIFHDPSVTKDHYIGLQMTGKLKNSTIERCPAVHQIICGEKPVDGVSFVAYAENGDMILGAPNGRIRIFAQDIDILAAGNGRDTGWINIESNATVNVNSPKVQATGTDSLTMSGERKLSLNSTGRTQVNTGGFKIVEGPDVSPITSPLGSGVNTLKQQLEGLKKLIESIG
jgi:hypothetical protein